MKLEKEEKKDLTRKRISVLISSDPQEEKKIRFDDRRRTTMIGLDERRQTNLIKIPENTIESEDVPEDNRKILPIIKEAPKRLKTILIHNEKFRSFLESSLKIRGNINIQIKLNEEEMNSLLQAKSLLLK